jgi:putative tributyrin esterase
MILNEVNFFSEVLSMRSSMNVLLPQRPLANIRSQPKPKYRTLYLLHGHSDDHTAWLRWSSIEKYAEGLNLVVVMPAVNLSFYTDMAHGKNYGEFISEEVPAMVREMFSLSADREDSFVAGLSMGGYGTFKLALTYPERYAAAASLSGALDVAAAIRGHGNYDEKVWREEMQNVFGDRSKVIGSKHDLLALAEKAARATVKPRLYQCCGTEDFLYEDNVRFRDAIRKLTFDYTYQQGAGEHDWYYWDTMIQRVLAWMFPQESKSP